MYQVFNATLTPQRNMNNNERAIATGNEKTREEISDMMVMLFVVYPLYLDVATP